MIDSLFRLPDPFNSVLSHYPPGEKQLYVNKDFRIPQMSIEEDYDVTLPEIKIFKAKLFIEPIIPIKSIGLAAGCLILMTNVLKYYPDKQFTGLFQGEEYFLLKTFEKNGVNIYAMPKIICLHQYKRVDEENTPIVWKDNPAFYQKEEIAVRQLANYIDMT